MALHRDAIWHFLYFRNPLYSLGKFLHSFVRGLTMIVKKWPRWGGYNDKGDRMTFEYQSENFFSARRALMLPHSRGESESIAEAFHDCARGLYSLDRAKLDDNARQWVVKLENLMDLNGLEDSNGRSPWAVKAKQLTVEQKIELSRVVDELTHWFDRKLWGND